MRRRTRVLIAAGLLACTGAVVWMFRGSPAGTGLVGNANVVGGLAGVGALVLTLISIWPRRAGGAAAGPATEGQRRAALEYLAGETLQYWQQQAIARRIATPSPAGVEWRWADPEIAVPPGRMQTRLLDQGLVTELREQLYEKLRDPARVVILGGPGAGKTSAMLLLLIDVLRNRAPDGPEPVPLWLTLGGWNPAATSLADWAANMLKRTFPRLEAPEYGGPGTARELIRQRRVALFMDGLDEMPDELQPAALDRLNREAGDLRLVLTSRPGAYQAAHRLWTTAVIQVLPVDPAAARRFLLAEQVGAGRARWERITGELGTAPSGPIARAFTSPLALALAREAYDRGDPGELLDHGRFPDEPDVMRHLLVRTFALAYPDEVERARATHWLAWIARRLDGRRDLCWWEIPDWGPDGWHGPQRRAVGAACGAAAFVLVTPALLLLVLSAVPAFGPEWGQRNVFAAAVFAILISWAVGDEAGRPDRDYVPRRFSVVGVVAPGDRPFRTTLALARTMAISLGLALLGLAGIALGGYVLGGSETLSVGLFLGVLFGMVGLVSQSAENGFDSFSEPFLPRGVIWPNLSYLTDRRRTMMAWVTATVGGAALGAFLGGVCWIAEPLTAKQTSSGVVWMVAGLVGGLLTGLYIGSFAALGPAVRVYGAELLWLLRGRPVRFMPLLERALEQQVLRQVGPVYQFRHALLQDYLAALTPGGSRRAGPPA